MSDFSRRTVVRGTAWTVPVIAIAAQAPAFATSQDPPPPVIDFGGACANTGADFKGCGTIKSLQVPLTLSNPTPNDIVFVITSMYTCNCGTAPTSSATGVPGATIYSSPGHGVDNHNQCTLVTPSTCGGVASVIVPAGALNQTFWIVGGVLGASNEFSATINWELRSANCATVLKANTAATSKAISPKNCSGPKNP